MTTNTTTIEIKKGDTYVLKKRNEELNDNEKLIKREILKRYRNKIKAKHGRDYFLKANKKYRNKLKQMNPNKKQLTTWQLFVQENMSKVNHLPLHKRFNELSNMRFRKEFETKSIIV